MDDRLTREVTLFCAAESSGAGESLHGTAPTAQVWLLLEVDQPWGSKAYPLSDLPQPVKAHLDGLLRAHKPDVRLLLIRQQPRRVTGGLRFYAAMAGLQPTRLFAFELGLYEDLLSLDLEQLLHSPDLYAEYEERETLYIVCTNGKRDPCCARLGLPVYGALASQAEERVWQSSHVGGHRFAGNVGCFPEGVFYGRVDLTVAADLLATQARRELYLKRYRGRSCFAEPVQAAEIYLRQELGILGLEELALQRVNSESAERVAAVFLYAHSGITYRVEVEVLSGVTQVRTSCQDEAASPKDAYRLAGITKP
jgi:hypothetical protein